MGRLSLEHMVWVLDEDMNPLGVVSVVTADGEEPTGPWRVEVRPDGVEGHRFLDFTDLGRRGSKHEAIEFVRAAASSHTGDSNPRGDVSCAD